MTDNKTIRDNKNDFSIDLQYLKDLSFENPSSPSIFFQKHTTPPQIKVNLNLDVKKLSEKSYEVVLTINAEAIGEGDKKHYITEIHYAAIATIKNESLEEEEVKKLLMIDVPKTIFPFARQIVATTIKDGGFLQLLLEPINFENLYAQHQKKNKTTS